MVDKNNLRCSLDDEQYREFKKKLYVFMAKNFSDQIQLNCCRIHPVVTLTAEENKIVENAVKKRCYEFSAGRDCARGCLESSGVSDFSLLKGKYGEPIWPQGFTGSITHNSGMAIAASMPQERGYIGIDLVDLSDHIAGSHLILNPVEVNARFENDVKNPELLLFSLKEAVIKILSPVMQEYIEFKDITITPRNGGADVSYRGESETIKLFWLVYDQYAFTVAVKAL